MSVRRVVKPAAAARDVAAATPGTDTFGTVFKILSVAGLAGLFILHPETLGGLQRGVSVIRTVITGVRESGANQ